MEGKRPTDKNGFMMYKSHWEAISDLEDKYLGQLMRAVFEYQIHGTEPEKHDIIYRDFKHLKAQFTIDDTKYRRVAERNAENGRAGGRPKKPNESNGFVENPENPVGFSKPRKADNDNDNDNDLLLSPTPSSAKPQKREKKQKEETTLEKAISHYKTETEKGKEAGPAADFDNFRKLGLEICGLAPTDDCPNGMVKTIMRLPEQLTFSQYGRLVKKMGGHATLREILVAMHNKYTQYLTKSTSINLIAQDWYQNKMSGKGNGGAKPDATVAKKQQYGPIGE